MDSKRALWLFNLAMQDKEFKAAMGMLGFYRLREPRYKVYPTHMEFILDTHWHDLAEFLRAWADNLEMRGEETDTCKVVRHWEGPCDK